MTGKRTKVPLANTKSTRPLGTNLRKDLPRETIIQLYLSGTGGPTLAKRYGCSCGCVDKLLKRAGVKMRSQTEANQLMAKQRSPEQRLSYIEKARVTRLNNLRKASYDLSLKNPAVGSGYHLLAGEVEKSGIRIQRQVKFGSYYLDLVMGNIAIEVEARPLRGHGFSVRTERFKYLTQRGKPVIYILFRGTAALEWHMDKVVALLNEARRAPPRGDEYWVIRCDLNRGFACNKDNKITAIARPKYSKMPINWMD